MEGSGTMRLPAFLLPCQESAMYDDFSATAEGIGEPKDLLACAALRGFWDLPVSMLRELATMYDVNIKDCSLIGVIEALCQAFIPNCTPKMLVDILHLRDLAYERTEDSLEDLVNSEWVVHHFDKDTAEFVMAEIKAAKEDKANRTAFRKDLSKYKAAARATSMSWSWTHE